MSIKIRLNKLGVILALSLLATSANATVWTITGGSLTTWFTNGVNGTSLQNIYEAGNSTATNPDAPGPNVADRGYACTGLVAPTDLICEVDENGEGVKPNAWGVAAVYSGTIDDVGTDCTGGACTGTLSWTGTTGTAAAAGGELFASNITTGNYDVSTGAPTGAFACWNNPAAVSTYGANFCGNTTGGGPPTTAAGQSIANRALPNGAIFFVDNADGTVSVTLSDTTYSSCTAANPLTCGSSSSDTFASWRLNYEVLVPDVVGDTVAAATAALAAVFLNVGTQTNLDDPAPIGQVIAQTPIANDPASTGSDVDLDVSQGLPLVDYVGLDRFVAEANMVTDGFAVGTPTQVASAQPADEVLSQNPTFPGQAAGGTPIDYTYSDGVGGNVDVPNVVGLDRFVAENDIVLAGLTVGTPTGVNNAATIDQVVSQNPVACTTCEPAGTPVDYTYSLGLPVGNYVGLDEAAANAQIVTDGFTVGTPTTVADPAPPGEVLAQNPAAATQQAGGTPIDLTVSDGLTVGNYVGLDQTTAEGNIVTDGFTVGTVTMVADPAPPGEVLAQNPAAASQAAGGTPIDLEVSMGLPVGTYTGLQQAAAEIQVVADGFTVGAIVMANSAQPVGEVVAQNPAAGGNAVGGTAIDLTVSDGALIPFPVPNVVGLDRTAAEAAILAASFTVGTATGVSSAQPLDEVVTQDPAGGSMAILGTAIDYEYSITTNVPAVIGLEQAAAEADVVAAGFVVGTITPVSSNTVPIGVVIAQTPAGGSRADVGTAVDLDVSSGLIVPDVVGMIQADAEAAITAAGFTLGSVETGRNIIVPAGEVAGQDPPGNTNQDPGTPVNLLVSTGAFTNGTQPGVKAMDPLTLLLLAGLPFLRRRRK